VKVDDQVDLIRAFEAEDIERYAALGGDQRRDGSIPEPLIGALFSTLLGIHLPGRGTNYLKQETEYVADGRVGERLHASVRVTRLRPDKHLVDLETLCHGEDERLIARGRALVYVEDVGA